MTKQFRRKKKKKELKPKINMFFYNIDLIECTIS